MALTTAVAIGAVAAIGVPWLAERNEEVLGGLLTGQIVHIPVGAGHEVHWSWLVFCVVTLLCWALLAAAKNK